MYAVRFAGGASSIVDIVGGNVMETYKGNVIGSPPSSALVRVI
jgi:hypothetical protein